MKIALLAIFFALMLAACSNEKIEITSEYIINENWSKKNEEAWANSITINKMNVRKDSIINPFLNLSQAEILSKLEDDSSFMHYANIKIERGGDYKDRPIYFDRYNGFYWGSKSRFNSADTVKTIGNLERKSWYKFSHLVAYPYHIYIYVDSMKNVHRFDVNLGNY